VSPTETTDRTAAAFKALGEPTRLRILALLARRPHYGEELAGILGLRPATVSHHLGLLRSAVLVHARRDSPYVLYHLDFDRLTRLAEQLVEIRGLHRQLDLPSEAELSAQLLAEFLDQEGQLRELPTERRSRTVVLRWAAQQLETGRLYPERELRLALLQIFGRPDELRQALLQAGWLQRSGLVYRRLEEVEIT